MNYEKMTKAELISKLKSLESRIENYKLRDDKITLQGSEEIYRKLLEIANDAIFLVDVETEIILNANKRAEDLLALPIEEIVGMNRSQMYPPEDIERNKKIFQKNIKIGSVITSEDIHILHNDGHKVPVEISANYFEVNGRKVVQAIFRDITRRKQTEDKMRKFSHAVDYGSAVVVITDIEGNIEYTNTQFVQVTGYSFEEAIGKNPRILKSGKTSPEVYRKLWETIKSGREWSGEFCNKKKNGELYWESVSISPVKDDKGVITNFIAIKENITERKQADEKIKRLNETLEQRVLERTKELTQVNEGIKESEARLQSIFSSLYEAAIIVYDRDGKIVDLWGTPEMDKRYGIRATDAVGKNVKEFLSPDQAEQRLAQIKRVIDTGDKIIVDNMITVPGGNFWQETSLCPMRNAEGNITDVVGFVRDINERKKSEKALREASELNKRIVSESPIGLAIYDQTGQCIEANASIAEMINATREQVLSQNYKNIESWKRCGLHEAANESIRLQENRRHEYDIVTTFGKNAFYDCTFVPFISNDEQHLLLILDEITDRKEAEKDICKKNSYLKLLQVTAVAANKATDVKDAFQPILAEICHYTGWEIGHAYAISENNPDLLKPTEVWCLEEQKQFTDFCNVTKKTDFPSGVGLPGRVLACGKPRWIVDVRKDKGFLRRKIAKELNIKSGIAFPVMVGPHVVAVLEFFTTKKEEPDQQFMEIMADVGTQLGRVVERKQSHEEVKVLAKFPSENPNPVLRVSNDGTILYNNNAGMVLLESWECQTTKILPDNYLKIVLDVLHSGLSNTVEDKSNNCIFSLTFAPVIEERYVNVYGLDISEGKKMEEALVQSEKMKAMGIMTAGIAHEFNNILAVISSNAQLLEENNRNDIELSKSLATICRIADDGAEIVDRMYGFTNVNRDISHYKIVDLNDLIQQVIGFTMPRWKEMAQAKGINYQIVWKEDKELPSVLGNPAELREVILNIINNALDAMPTGGMITVSTRYVLSKQFGVESKKEKVSKLRTQNHELKSDFIEITFTDTGSGMSEEVKKKMFDPFFTTRCPEGTGLGMSVSYGIITRHRGKIDVESKSGKGSVISLRLPVTAKSTHHVVAPEEVNNLNIAGLNILVVDDKEEICKSLSKILSDDGHKVCSVKSGADALNQLNKNSYDLLICDLIMPDVNGRDVVNAIKTMNKKPKVGLITGWRYKMDDAEKEGLEVDFIIKKPFSLSRLRRDINNLWS